MGDLRRRGQLALRASRDRARARRAGSAVPTRFIVNALPKAGTHLVIKLVEQFPDVHRIRFQLSQVAYPLLRPAPGEPTVPLGVAWPRAVSQRKTRRHIAALPPGSFITAHAPYSPALADILAALDVRMLVALRDPRDVVVSGAEYIASNRSHPLHAVFAAADHEERLRLSLFGVEPRAGGSGLLDAATRVASVAQWESYEGAYIVRFERLVGRPGGGSDEEQRAEVHRIAAHLGVSLSDDGTDALAKGLHGGTPTFRRGRVGGWREDFTPSIARAAADGLGDLLERLGYESDPTWHERLDLPSHGNHAAARRDEL